MCIKITTERLEKPFEDFVYFFEISLKFQSLRACKIQEEADNEDM
jgi:hypothetical protein